MEIRICRMMGLGLRGEEISDLLINRHSNECGAGSRRTRPDFASSNWRFAKPAEIP